MKCALCESEARQGICTECGATGTEYGCGTVVSVRMTGEPGSHTMDFKMSAYGPNAQERFDAMEKSMKKAVRTCR